MPRRSAGVTIYPLFAPGLGIVLQDATTNFAMPAGSENASGRELGTRAAARGSLMAFRIGVISDTHGVVHPAVGEVFANVDHIIHAGDIGGEDVLEAQRQLAPVTSVEGNNDYAGSSEFLGVPRVADLDARGTPRNPRNPRNQDPLATGEDILRLELSGLRILLTHILPRPTKRDARVVESLQSAPADVVFFGHSHLPHNEVLDGVRYFNPASSGPRRFNYPVSVGLFEKRGKTWKSVHVALDERSVEALNKWMNQLSRR
jgi:uncharacterized protein